MKKAAIIIIVISLSVVAISLLVVRPSAPAQRIQWMPFIWYGDNYGGKRHDKVSMYIPVTLDSLPNKLNMQLDLGSPHTLIWGNPIQPYLDKYAQLRNKIDTSETATHFWMNNIEYTSDFRGINFKLGNVSFGKRDICYYTGFGATISKDSINTQSAVSIGNIGEDIFKDKVIIIDYPNDRIGIANEIPEQYTKATFQPFALIQGLIVTPFVINDKREDLIYDNGTGIDLVTSEKNALQISGNAIVDSFPGSSWGLKYMGYYRKINVNIFFGNKQLKTGGVVTYNNPDTDGDFLTREDIWGTVGNNFFFNNVIIIDYKNYKFGIM